MGLVLPEKENERRIVFTLLLPGREIFLPRVRVRPQKDQVEGKENTSSKILLH